MPRCFSSLAPRARCPMATTTTGVSTSSAALFYRLGFEATGPSQCLRLDHIALGHRYEATSVTRSAAPQQLRTLDLERVALSAQRI